jgi:hypothetical protein
VNPKTEDMLRAGQKALFETCPEYTIEEREGLAGEVFVAMLTAALDGGESLPPPDTHTYDEDEKRDVWSYSPALVMQIVQMKREKESSRLWSVA